MNKEQIIALFKKQKGWLKSVDFNYQSTVYKHIKTLIDKGEVEKVKSGLFRHPAFSAMNDLEELTQLYPQGVFCLFSAWSHYELSTTLPFQHHLALPHKANPKKIAYPPVTFYFWSQKQYELGITQKDDIAIYDIEKSVCDAVKFRNKVGEEITFEVLKNYIKSEHRNIEKLMNYAKIMRIANIISPMLKPLLSVRLNL